MIQNEMTMKKVLLVLLGCLAGFASDVYSQTIHIRQSTESPRIAYAAKKLKKALSESGYTLTDGKAAYEINLVLKTDTSGSEAYSITPAARTITVTGSDENGLLYGCLALGEDLRNGTTLPTIKARQEKANLPFRAIKFNLPWDTYRHSQALDQHWETCRDLRFWEAFLDMMAQNRFNALTLWNLHPFPFMIRPTNFPEASPFTNQELADWQALYRGIFRLAKERGIDTYLVNWNIYVSPEFAKAHQVALDNLDHKIHATGDTSAIIKRYTRECVTQVLNEYPDLTGLGFTHGEAMWGMTPRQRQDWFSETILAGMRQASRKAKLIHRVPLSANLALGGSTSVDTEQLTRNAMEELDFLDGPIWAEIKFNWSHAFSSPKLIKVHGGKLNDTYFTPMPKNYKIAWMARNEDFFCLRWGVPGFIREHIATNTQPYVGGYFVGSECYIPAKDYFTKPGLAVDWQYAFERQWLFYKLWGRLLYDPATPDAVFKAEFTHRYGKGAEPLLEASALAGTTPLRLASYFDFTWDFTLYSEGFMALNNKSMDFISVDRQISQPPADGDYVSVLEYVKTVAKGGSFGKNRITPPDLIRQLEQDCQKALALVKPVKTPGSALQQEVADVKAWAHLGLYFAQKLRGAVALQTYRIQGDEKNKALAIRHLQNALKQWDEVIALTRPLYNDMPLVHFSESDDTRRFHWGNLRPAVANDIDIARNASVTLTN